MNSVVSSFSLQSPEAILRIPFILPFDGVLFAMGFRYLQIGIIAVCQKSSEYRLRNFLDSLVVEQTGNTNNAKLGPLSKKAFDPEHIVIELTGIQTLIEETQLS